MGGLTKLNIDISCIFFMNTGDPGRDARKNEETWTEPHEPLAGEAAVHLQHGQHH